MERSYPIQPNQHPYQDIDQTTQAQKEERGFFWYLFCCCLCSGHEENNASQQRSINSRNGAHEWSSLLENPQPTPQKPAGMEGRKVVIQTPSPEQRPKGILKNSKNDSSIDSGGDDLPKTPPQSSYFRDSDDETLDSPNSKNKSFDGNSNSPFRGFGGMSRGGNGWNVTEGVTSSPMKKGNENKDGGE